MPNETEPEIFIEENAPRDGIQNESAILSPEERAALIDALSDCGFQRIQAGSFVDPRRVPQMAETEKVLELIRRRPGTVYSVLALNERGLERAIASNVEHISLFASASETHSRANSNCSVAEGLKRVVKLVESARNRGMSVQAGVMNAFGCRSEGLVPPERVMGMVRALAQAGADEINLADTSGIAHPGGIERLVPMAGDVPGVKLSLHLHDTYGFGLANVYAAWKAGARRFDSSCGGLGGCPFIPGAAGNVATEDVVHLFESMGVSTGVLLTALGKVALDLEKKFERRLPGRYARICAPDR